jgi:toxin ParE1/3/4
MAKLPIDYHPEARAEADAAFEWYLARNVGAAARFQRQLETAQSSIQNSPDTWAAYLYGTRRYTLRRYPFVVVYRERQGRIEIVAVAHGHRQPGYWAHRLD